MRIVIIEGEFYKAGLRGPGTGFIKELSVKSSEHLSFNAVYAAPSGILFPEWRRKSFEYKHIHGIPWSLGKRPYAYFVMDILKTVRTLSRGSTNVRLVTKGMEKAKLFSAVLGMTVEDLGDEVPPVRELKSAKSCCENHDFATKNCASVKASCYLGYLLGHKKDVSFI